MQYVKHSGTGIRNLIGLLHIQGLKSQKSRIKITSRLDKNHKFRGLLSQYHHSSITKIESGYLFCVMVSITYLPRNKITPIDKSIHCLEITNFLKIMQFPNYLYQVTLEELYGQVMFSNIVTRSDRQMLKDALLKESLSENEHDIINRLIYNVRRGWVRLVD